MSHFFISIASQNDHEKIEEKPASSGLRLATPNVSELQRFSPLLTSLFDKEEGSSSGLSGPYKKPSFLQVALFFQDVLESFHRQPNPPKEVVFSFAPQGDSADRLELTYHMAEMVFTQKKRGSEEFSVPFEQGVRAFEAVKRAQGSLDIKLPKAPHKSSSKKACVGKGFLQFFGFAFSFFAASKGFVGTYQLADGEAWEKLDLPAAWAATFGAVASFPSIFFYFDSYQKISRNIADFFKHLKAPENRERLSLYLAGRFTQEYPELREHVTMLKEVFAILLGAGYAAANVGMVIAKFPGILDYPGLKEVIVGSLGLINLMVGWDKSRHMVYDAFELFTANAPVAHFEAEEVAAGVKVLSSTFETLLKISVGKTGLSGEEKGQLRSSWGQSLELSLRSCFQHKQVLATLEKHMQRMQQGINFFLKLKKGMRYAPESHPELKEEAINLLHALLWGSESLDENFDQVRQKLVGIRRDSGCVLDMGSHETQTTQNTSSGSLSHLRGTRVKTEGSRGDAGTPLLESASGNGSLGEEKLTGYSLSLPELASSHHKNKGYFSLWEVEPATGMAKVGWKLASYLPASLAVLSNIGGVASLFGYAAAGWPLGAVASLAALSLNVKDTDRFVSFLRKKWGAASVSFQNGSTSFRWSMLGGAGLSTLAATNTIFYTMQAVKNFPGIQHWGAAAKGAAYGVVLPPSFLLVASTKSWAMADFLGRGGRMVASSVRKIKGQPAPEQEILADTEEVKFYEVMNPLLHRHMMALLSMYCQKIEALRKNPHLTELDRSNLGLRTIDAKQYCANVEAKWAQMQEGVLAPNMSRAPLSEAERLALPVSFDTFDNSPIGSSEEKAEETKATPEEIEGGRTYGTYTPLTPALNVTCAERSESGEARARLYHLLMQEVSGWQGLLKRAEHWAEIVSDSGSTAQVALALADMGSTAPVVLGQHEAFVSEV